MTRDTLAPIGRIDLHSHLLPGVDDGCTSVEESLACVRRLKGLGYVGTVCTPHINPRFFPANIPAAIARWVDRLQQVIDEAGLDYRLWPGGELRIAEETIGWLEDFGVPTLGEGRFVLADYWGTSWPAFADDVCQYLMERDYELILAHPERLAFDDEHLDATLTRLAEMGIWLQGNFNSVAGGEGPAAARWSKRLLCEGRYQLVASDMHRPDTLQRRLEGLADIERTCAPDHLATLLETRPRALLRPTAHAEPTRRP